MIDFIGRTLLNRYRVEELIGRGGMVEDMEFVRRFRREATLLARREHITQ